MPRQPDPHTSVLPRKRPQDQVSLLQQVEPGPIDVGQRVKQKRGAIDGIGDEVTLALNGRGNVSRNLAYRDGLSAEIDAVSLIRLHGLGRHLETKWFT